MAELIFSTNLPKAKKYHPSKKIQRENIEKEISLILDSYRSISDIEYEDIKIESNIKGVIIPVSRDGLFRWPRASYIVTDCSVRLPKHIAIK